MIYVVTEIAGPLRLSGSGGTYVSAGFGREAAVLGFGEPAFPEDVPVAGLAGELERREASGRRAKDSTWPISMRVPAGRPPWSVDSVMSIAVIVCRNEATPSVVPDAA